MVGVHQLSHKRNMTTEGSKVHSSGAILYANIYSKNDNNDIFITYVSPSAVVLDNSIACN